MGSLNERRPKWPHVSCTPPPSPEIVPTPVPELSSASIGMELRGKEADMEFADGGRRDRAV